MGGDDKVGVAAIIETVRTLVEEGGEYPTVKIIFSVQEETGCCGAANFDAANFEPGEPCFVFDDAGDVGGACLAAPYHYTFTARFIGKASHAGVAPEQGVSAIEAACCAVERMRQAACSVPWACIARPTSVAYPVAAQTMSSPRNVR